MARRRFRILGVRLLVALTAIAGATTAGATTVVYRSDDQLFDEATVVVHGTVRRREAIQPPNGAPFTAYELEAIECFKGCRAGQSIIALAPGFDFANEAGLTVPVAGSPALVPGERVLIYLTRVTAGGPLVPISLGLSVYKVQFDPDQKRDIARRQIDQLSIVTEARVGHEDGNPRVKVPRDRVAAELMTELRKLAQSRSAR